MHRGVLPASVLVLKALWKGTKKATRGCSHDELALGAAPHGHQILTPGWFPSTQPGLPPLYPASGHGAWVGASWTCKGGSAHSPTFGSPSGGTKAPPALPLHDALGLCLGTSIIAVPTKVVAASWALVSLLPQGHYWASSWVSKASLEMWLGEGVFSLWPSGGQPNGAVTDF